jgi:hypothetical protein
LFDE